MRALPISISVRDPIRIPKALLVHLFEFPYITDNH